MSTEQELIRIHRRISKVCFGVNVAIIRRSLNRKNALGWTSALRSVAEDIEKLIGKKDG